MTRQIAVSVLLLALALAAPASAQCFADDGFDLATCCIPTTPTLPVFPPAVLAADGACFINCTVEQTFPVQVVLGAPIPIFCDVYAVPITITGGVNTATTYMVAKYQRTWEEASLFLGNRQVWRFLVNVDLVYQAYTAAQIPCPVPATAPNMPVHFYGHLDYSLDCATGVMDTSFSLTHLCGSYMHAPWSARPVSPNPNPGRVYAFAGPNFDFNLPTAPPSGMVVADAVRSTLGDLSTWTWQCYSEIDVIGGALTDLGQSCPCTDPSFPALGLRWNDQDLNFLYDCATPVPFNYQSVPWAPLAPTGLKSFQLGSFVNAAGITGKSVAVYFGIALAPDPCGNNFPIHVVTGVGTSGGAPGIFTDPFGVTVFSNRFLDLENTLVLGSTASGGLGLSIGFGALHLSTMTFGLNML